MSWLTHVRLRQALAGLAAAASCAAAAVAVAQDDEGLPLSEYYEIRPAVRSLGQERDTPIDERRRPRYAERQTHRGWEVTHDSFTVVAKTSRADALWAAEEAARAWDDMGRVADKFTGVHRRKNFGIGAFTVLIDNDRKDPRRTPNDGLAVTSDHAVIYLNAGPGSEPLDERLGVLRRATSEAFLHVTAMDRQLPAWVQQGLAAYVAKLPPPEAQLKAPGTAPPNTAAGSAAVTQPKYAPPDELMEQTPMKERITSDRATPADEDDEPEEEESTAELWVRYLIEGDDARHAPAFFASLQSTVHGSEEEADDNPEATRINDRTPQFGPAKGELDTSPIDGLIEERTTDPKGIGAWLKDGDVDLPLFQPSSDTTPAQLAAEKEMLFVLKLVRRFGNGIENAAGVKPRVTEFGAGGQQEVKAFAPEAERWDLASLYRKLTDPDTPPWATLDPSGRLLTNEDDDQLAQLLGIGQNRYRTELRDGKRVLVRPIGRSTALEGWLEEDTANPRRPKAKFEIVVGG